MKTCSKCGESKPLTEYYARKDRPDGLQSHCKACRNEGHRAWRAANPEKNRADARAWYAANPDKSRARSRRNKYGTDGVALLQEQGGACAICNTALAALPPLLRHLDHCHTSSKVRGWLCKGCNTGIGIFTDSPERLRLAAAYLEKHSA